MTAGKAASRYADLEAERSPYLQRAKECAELTLPYLKNVLSDDAQTGKIVAPYQGIGARGTRNLASKLLLTLFPPNTPFFRLNVADELLEDNKIPAEQRSQVEKALGKIERRTMKEVENSGDRTKFFDCNLHLVVAGNVLLHVANEGTRNFYLNRYVVKRSPHGEPVEMLTKETDNLSVLPEEFVEKLKRLPGFDEMVGNEKGEIDIYTHIRRNSDGWTWEQEALGHKIPGTNGNSPIDACPWIPLRFVQIDGEDYGRAYVEEFYGDLSSLEVLTKAVVEGSAAAAKLLLLVNPGGTTRVKDIAEAENGSVKSGNAQDVTILQMNKQADFRVAKELMMEIEKRIEFAFLLNTAIQRSGERVTAEEIRFMAADLEDALGGTYTVLSQDFQRKYVTRRLKMLTRQGRIPKLPHKYVTPTIVTGIEALGRGHDRNKLIGFIQTLATAIGPDALKQYLNLGDFISRLATSDGIDTEGLIKSQEQISQEQQQEQMMQMVQRLGPQAIQQMGAMAQQQQPQGTPNAAG